MKSGIIIAIVFVVAVLVGAYFFVGSGGYKTPSTPSSSSGPNTVFPTNPDANVPSNTGATHSVSISNFAFNPLSLTVSVGDTVVWTNDDSASHTITSDSGSELASSSFSKGQTYSHTFTKSGTFDYHCSIHTMMKAKIIVQ